MGYQLQVPDSTCVHRSIVVNVPGTWYGGVRVGILRFWFRPMRICFTPVDSFIYVRMNLFTRIPYQVPDTTYKYTKRDTGPVNNPAKPFLFRSDGFLHVLMGWPCQFP